MFPPSFVTGDLIRRSGAEACSQRSGFAMRWANPAPGVVRLVESGVRSFTILEKSGSLGGTWWDNAYPGVQCDVRSHLYTFSFAPNPGWSRVYAPQAEILAYMQRVADKWRLHDHIRLNTGVAEAHFDETRGQWEATTSAGEVLHADVLVCSTGPLSQPRYPDIPGLAGFGGALMHSAR